MYQNDGYIQCEWRTAVTTGIQLTFKRDLNKKARADGSGYELQILTYKRNVTAKKYKMKFAVTKTKSVGMCDSDIKGQTIKLSNMYQKLSIQNISSRTLDVIWKLY
jgi:hypothetical protein